MLGCPSKQKLRYTLPVDDHKEVATVDGLEQVTTVYFVCQQTCIMFILCRVMWYVHQSEDFLLFTFLKKNLKKKVTVPLACLFVIVLVCFSH